MRIINSCQQLYAYIRIIRFANHPHQRTAMDTATGEEEGVTGEEVRNEMGEEAEGEAVVGMGGGVEEDGRKGGEEEKIGEVGGKRERVGRDQEGAEEEANSSQYICTLDFFESTLACVK